MVYPHGPALCHSRRAHVVRETDVASVGITIADDDVNDPLFDTVHG
jgi:hypothetical protein